ncbi:serine/threonine-protein kinase [Ktedonospora formicarum]|uniref:Protein kinase domain-containing protein n=1 Tax=Ktedonospora formicarum TaxID=2778364 RepID=A0A8J3HX71_9CHLR|nr:serine/threonine-protein kinase [Ktedonospora formicarum]GHO42705.1 hypothetical protein KSX_08680 [Ktedonospora formicarum]
MMYRVGQQLGNYRVTNFLGEGPHAQVFIGEHISTKAPVAIKVLRVRLPQDEYEKFARSARRIASLSHPHIARVVDFGIEWDLPYIVMELALNGNLRRRHPAGSRLSLQRIASYTRQIVDALQYAHGENYMHQQLKPENMLLNKRGEVLLSDFNMPLSMMNTYTQDTALYVSPEQLQGVARPASDQYLLGLVLYEWFTGERPIYNPLGDRILQYGSLLPPLRSKVSSIPVEIEEVVMTTLAREPHRRFKDMRAFSYAFDQAFQLRSASGPLGATPRRTNITALGQTGRLTPLPATFDEQSQSAPPTPQITGRPIWTARAHQGAIRSISWSFDGRRLVSAGNDTKARVWDVSTGKFLVTYHGHNTGVHTVGWSPKGLLIASAGYDREVHIWSATRGAQMRTYQGHTQPIRSLAWSVDGQHVASVDGPDGTVRIWEAMTGAEQALFTPQASEPTALTWSPDGTCVAVASVDGSVQIWQINNAAKQSKGRVFSEPSYSSVQAIAWSPSKTFMASGGEEKIIHVWNTNTGRDKLAFTGHTQTIHSLSWSPDSNILASASADGTIRLWDTHTGVCGFSYSTKHPPMHTVSWSPNGRYLASTDADGVLQIWEIQFASK